MNRDLSFVHHFEPGTRADAPALLLLHGTGGDEHDLLPLGRIIAPHSALLSPRGKVLERGMPRFFRRLAEGVLDEEDVRRRAHELANFITDARKRYGIGAPIALGYSNGANVAAAVLLLRPEQLSGAILMRAMVPLSQAPKVDLGGKPVLILSGAGDPIIAGENAARLASSLRAAGAAVEHHALPAGHELSQADVTLARDWLEKREAETAHEPTHHIGSS
jgi:phospholipase/carboxylesterase